MTPPTSTKSDAYSAILAVRDALKKPFNDLSDRQNAYPESEEHMSPYAIIGDELDRIYARYSELTRLLIVLDAHPESVRNETPVQATPTPSSSKKAQPSGSGATSDSSRVLDPAHTLPSPSRSPPRDPQTQTPVPYIPLMREPACYGEHELEAGFRDLARRRALMIRDQAAANQSASTPTPPRQSPQSAEEVYSEPGSLGQSPAATQSARREERSSAVKKAKLKKILKTSSSAPAACKPKSLKRSRRTEDDDEDGDVNDDVKASKPSPAKKQKVRFTP